MSLLEIVRIQQAQDRERLEIEHDLQEAQARVQGGEDTYKAYVVDGQALGQELAEKRKLLDERKAYCLKLELKNLESEKNTINLENVLVMSNTNLRLQVQEETRKQEARRAELESASEVLRHRAKEDVAALGIDPDSNTELLEIHPEFGFVRLVFTSATVDQMKSDVDQLQQEVHRLTEELSDFDARSSAGDGHQNKRQKIGDSMSTDELAQLVSQAEEEVERLRRVKEGKLAERESLNSELTADE